MRITIASGKGGTGKTTLAVNLACTLARTGKNLALLDCDVEEPNDHLFLKPEFTRSETVTVLKPVLKESTCTGCGLCAEVCTYNAVAVIKGKVLFFPELCHACGACSALCPEGAIEESPFPIGTVQSGTVDKHLPEAAFHFTHGDCDQPQQRRGCPHRGVRRIGRGPGHRPDSLPAGLYGALFPGRAPGA